MCLVSSVIILLRAPSINCTVQKCSYACGTRTNAATNLSTPTRRPHPKTRLQRAGVLSLATQSPVRAGIERYLEILQWRSTHAYAKGTASSRHLLRGNERRRAESARGAKSMGSTRSRGQAGHVSFRGRGSDAGSLRSRATPTSHQPHFARNAASIGR